MEMELGLKITHTRDDITSFADLRISKDHPGPLFLSRETESAFLLIAYLRGFKKENVGIKINKEGDRIEITGEKPVQEMVMMGWIVYKKEVELRAFRKVFRIPDGTLLDKIKAKFDDDEAVLTIFIPKSERGMRNQSVEEVKEVIPPGDHPEKDSPPEPEMKETNQEGKKPEGVRGERKERKTVSFAEVREGEEEGFRGECSSSSGADSENKKEEEGKGFALEEKMESEESVEEVKEVIPTGDHPEQDSHSEPEMKRVNNEEIGGKKPEAARGERKERKIVSFAEVREGEEEVFRRECSSSGADSENNKEEEENGLALEEKPESEETVQENPERLGEEECRGAESEKELTKGEVRHEEKAESESNKEEMTGKSLVDEGRGVCSSDKPKEKKGKFCSSAVIAGTGIVVSIIVIAISLIRSKRKPVSVRSESGQ